MPIAVAALVARWLLRRRALGAIEAALAAVFVLFSGALLVGINLAVAAGVAGVKLLAAWFTVFVGAGLAAWLVAQLRRRMGDVRYDRIVNVVVAVGLLVVVWVLSCFVRSPLAAPGSFRVSDRNAAQPSGDGLNVLWIVLDTARADRLGVHGYDRPTTPFLDDWAKRATVFERAVANGVWTVPSHASMFTGLSARAHGMDNPHTLVLSADLPTVAERLAEAGYATACFSANPWIARHSGLARGFTRVGDTYHLRHLTRNAFEYLAEIIGVVPPLPWLDGDYGAALANQRVADWLDEQVPGAAPHLVFVNYMEAHAPYRVPQVYRREFMDDAALKRSYALRRSVFGDLVQNLQLRIDIDGADFLDPADREILNRQYDAALRYMDMRVEELLGLYERRGLLDRTLVVVVSDHGEYLGNHGMWAHGLLAYNAMTDVTLMIRTPKQSAGRRVTAPAQLSDLHATILHAALGIPVAQNPFGPRDLLAPALTADQPRVAIAEFNAPAADHVVRMERRNNPKVKHRMAAQTAVHDGRFKYLVSADGTKELYDVVADPGESLNLLDTHPDIAARLAARLEAWLEATPKYEPPADTDGGMDDATRRALEALGYVGGADDDGAEGGGAGEDDQPDSADEP